MYVDATNDAISWPPIVRLQQWRRFSCLSTPVTYVALVKMNSFCMPSVVRNYLSVSRWQCSNTWLTRINSVIGKPKSSTLEYRTGARIAVNFSWSLANFVVSCSLFVSKTLIYTQASCKLTSYTVTDIVKAILMRFRLRCVYIAVHGSMVAVGGGGGGSRRTLFFSNRNQTAMIRPWSVNMFIRS